MVQTSKQVIQFEQQQGGFDFLSIIQHEHTSQYAQGQQKHMFDQRKEPSSRQTSFPFVT